MSCPMIRRLHHPVAPCRLPVALPPIGAGSGEPVVAELLALPARHLVGAKLVDGEGCVIGGRLPVLQQEGAPIGPDGPLGEEAL